MTDLRNTLFLFIYVHNFVLFVYYSIPVIFCVFYVFISCIVRSSLWLLYCNNVWYRSKLILIGSGYAKASFVTFIDYCFAT